MDASRGLITRIVDEGRINEVKRSGITTDFLDSDFASVFNYIERHNGDYKSVPSRDAVLKAFPNFDFGDYKEPLEYFIDSLKESYRRNVLEEKIEKVAGVYTKDTKEAEQLLREALSDLQITSRNFKDINTAEHALERFEQYKIRKTQAPEDGILSGWRSLDYQTLGWHEEEFVVLVGEKYMGKSWQMIWLAHQALLQNEKVLFVTKEMSQEAVTRRFDAIFASIKFDSLRRGELSNVEEERYKEKMEELSKSTHHFVVAREGVSTIDDIKQKAIEVDATIVFGDSIYLFLPDQKQTFSGETHKRLEISRACKQTARDLAIPFIASVQAGRRKTKQKVPDLDDIEWSNAFSQDADTVIYVHKDDLDREINRSQMYLLKSRDGNLAKFYINQDFDYMQFTQRDDEMEPSTDIDIDEEETVFDE